MSIGIIEMALGAEKESVSLPVPEAQVMTLREVFARYDGGCFFKAGDLVTPRKGYNHSNEGIPHIVLEVGTPPCGPVTPASLRETHSTAFGRRLDMRIAGHDRDGDVSAWWVESWCFEPWTGEGPANG
ncbi:hypothetical protein ACETRX_04105 [Labrys portucalensis]|jgi:hypothetical protein|uniref:Uncharacterized protein n=1 Tax=Labrys neptuniae TaxID=376174 RepID=A0ABV6Z9D4_9HYPH